MYSLFIVGTALASLLCGAALSDSNQGFLTPRANVVVVVVVVFLLCVMQIFLTFKIFNDYIKVIL